MWAMLKEDSAEICVMHFWQNNAKQLSCLRICAGLMYCSRKLSAIFQLLAKLYFQFPFRCQRDGDACSMIGKTFIG